jgi:biotin transport system substrate-specific component
MFYPDYIAQYKPRTNAGAIAFNVFLVLSASLFIAFSSQLEFFIPFSPVPVTAQTFAVLLSGLILGRVGGASAVIAYLAEGSIGLPFFAGGSSGFHHFLSPSGGYLIGFIAAAYLAGFFAEIGWSRKRHSLLIALSLSDLSIYLFGIPWLSIYVGHQSALQLGFFPFLFGDFVKILLISLSLPLLLKKAESEMS